MVSAHEKKYSPTSINLDKNELENLIKKIVRSELKNIKPNNESDGLSQKKNKSVKEIKIGVNMNSLTKAELLAISKDNKLTVKSKNTKAEIIKKLKENNVKVI